MYRELLSNIIAGHNWAKLHDPCDEKELTAAEEYVGYPFPAELKNLLRETDGDHFPWHKLLSM